MKATLFIVAIVIASVAPGAYVHAGSGTDGGGGGGGGGPTTTIATVTTTTVNTGPACSQPVTNGPLPTASDCLFILRAAVGSSVCSLRCACNPNGAGGITATDALLCLKKAVGHAVELNCSCGGGTSTTSSTVEPTTTVPPPPVCMRMPSCDG